MITPVEDELLRLLPCDFIRAADRDEWLRQRAQLNTVGASDIGCVLGLSPFATALELWLVKTGTMPRAEGDNLMRLGLAMQPVIARLWSEDNGIDLVDFDNVLLHRWPLSATLDYATGNMIPVEVKRVTTWQRKEWSDGPPAHYVAQVQQQMAITGSPSAFVVALIGDDLRDWLIERDDHVIAKIERAAVEFISQVERGEPPMPDFGHATTVDVMRSLPGDPDAVKTLDTAAAAAVDQWLAAKLRRRDADNCAAANESRIHHAMGEATFALLPDGRRIKRTKARGAWRVSVYQPKRRR